MISLFPLILIFIFCYRKVHSEERHDSDPLPRNREIPSFSPYFYRSNLPTIHPTQTKNTTVVIPEDHYIAYTTNRKTIPAYTWIILIGVIIGLIITVALIHRRARFRGKREPNENIISVTSVPPSSSPDIVEKDTCYGKEVTIEMHDKMKMYTENLLR